MGRMKDEDRELGERAERAFANFGQSRPPGPPKPPPPPDMSPEAIRARNAAYWERIHPDLLTRLNLDARRIMLGGVYCLQCGKFLKFPFEATDTDAREELRDEGWSILPEGFLCNECTPE